MRKSFFAIGLSVVAAIVLLGVLVSGCDGGACTGEIEVKATLCDAPWEGNVQYTLTGPGAEAAPITGTNVSSLFDDVKCGNWTCEYVSGGSPGAYLVDITPDPTQEVTNGEVITFTLNFELEQDASIEFVTWTINGQPVQPNTPQEPYIVNWGDIMGTQYRQYVDGCHGKEVTVDETSWFEAYYMQGPVIPWACLYVLNDDCALNKTPAPIEKVSQVPSIMGWTVDPGEEFCSYVEPGWGMDLHVETSWELVKVTEYTKAINWLYLGQWEGEEPCCALFEFYGDIAPGDYYFTLVSAAEVELVDDEDVNEENNYAESLPLYLVMHVPGP